MRVARINLRTLCVLLFGIYLVNWVGAYPGVFGDFAAGSAGGKDGLIIARDGLTIGLTIDKATPTFSVLSDSGSNSKVKEEDKRELGRFMFEIGLGFPTVSYGSKLDTLFNMGTAYYGITRTTIMINVILGWYMGNDIYLLLNVSGIGDRLEAYSDGSFIQLNTYLLGPGVRIYPYGKGLALGGVLGATRAVISASYMGSVASKVGLGGKLFATYDLINRYRGFGLNVGVDAAYRWIESEQITSASVFLDLVWK